MQYLFLVHTKLCRPPYLLKQLKNTLACRLKRRIGILLLANLLQLEYILTVRQESILVQKGILISSKY